MTRGNFFKSLAALVVAPVAILSSKKTMPQDENPPYLPQPEFHYADAFEFGPTMHLPEGVYFEKHVGEVIRMHKWEHRITINHLNQGVPKKFLSIDFTDVQGEERERLFQFANRFKTIV